MLRPHNTTSDGAVTESQEALLLLCKDCMSYASVEKMSSMFQHSWELLKSHPLSISVSEDKKFCEMSREVSESFPESLLRNIVQKRLLWFDRGIIPNPLLRMSQSRFIRTQDWWIESASLFITSEPSSKKNPKCFTSSFNEWAHAL